MSRAARVVAVIATLLLSMTTSVAAQGGASSRIRAQQRLVDSLVGNVTKARTALKAFDDSVSRMLIKTDSVRIGNLQALVEPAVRERAERAMRVASPKLDSLAGTAARRLQGDWLVIRAARYDTLRDTLVVAIRTHRGFDGYRDFSALWGKADDTTLAKWVYQQGVTVLSMTPAGEMQRWLYGPLMPDTMTTAQWLSARLEIVSSGTSVSLRCYDGDLSACRQSLRLTGVSDLVTEWYDAATRRRYIANIRRHSRNTDPDWDLCVEGSDDACTNAMRRVSHFADPIPPHQRRTVVLTAIQMAGARGYERFLNGTGTPSEQVASIAGVPLDSVLRVWLRSVHDARRPAQDMTPGIAVASLGWILVCGALALRSSRWR